jgi:hypothetical protein
MPAGHWQAVRPAELVVPAGQEVHPVSPGAAAPTPLSQPVAL